MSDLDKALAEFVTANQFRGKGPLCVALVVTEHAIKSGLPLDPEKLLTDGGGQVLGLGKGAVQAILKRHHIEKVLAAEGGRTSRGSLGNMRAYVSFLNSRAEAGELDLAAVEHFWIARVIDFFAGKPFRIRLDTARGLRALVRDVIRQAEERQRSSPGTQYAGTVMQHLVGAKLDCALGPGSFEHHSASTADAPSGRAGDFIIGDVAIHVTTSPSESLLEKCRDNLNAGLRPVIVTLTRGVIIADGLGENLGIADRVDVFEAEQFIALNLYELGGFAVDRTRVAVGDLVNRYNAIVEEVETDPSLLIELKT